METGLGSWDGIKEIGGAANLILQHDMIPMENEVIIRSDDNFLIPFHPEYSSFDLDWAAGKIAALRDYCTELGIPLLYASFPAKASYTNDDPADYGICAIDRERRVRFLEKIREFGVPVLDMDEVLKDRGFSQEDVFYRTDHHWKTRMGLIAAKEIAKFLEKKMFVDAYPELLEEELFQKEEYRYRWLGETGRKVSSTWAGTLDDYVFLEPDYDTQFTYHVPSAQIEEEGSFSDFTDQDLLSRKPDLYKDSLHYTYMKDSEQVIRLQNRNLSGANILMIKDSYSVPVAPFLAEAVGDLFWWDMRKNSDTVYDYIDKHHFDAIVVAYTDFFRSEMYDFR